ncbi:hypothetical protein DICVIV_07637 [Dictyocaulus viviparus]|uniref:Pre-SET domain-containing protein n=1 Tax=Dictyocaulus viviparus TaxID=29172 RepID=A0A0D8XR97_DICVI|nr:hypothetical protein DICVIV_07637 [Dictyocaulus viviparus]
MTSQKKRIRLWNEEEKVIEACAATILYRKRRNASILPIPSSLNDLIKQNQLLRLENMMMQLLPEPKFRSGNCSEESCSVGEDFGELIYNPVRDGTKCRYRLCRDISFGKEVFPVQVYSDTHNCVPPEDFIYISSNDYSKFKSDCPFIDDSLFTVNCCCSDLICAESCFCRKMNDKLTPCTIMGDGRVFLNSNATFFNTLIVGCGEKCSCRAKCKNTLSGVCLPAPFNHLPPCDERKDDYVVPNVHRSEIRHAISSIRNRTAPGPDRIRPEHLKNLPQVLIETLARLFTRYLSEYKVPSQWKTSRNVLLRK